MKLCQLKGLGPKSEKSLNEIGVFDKEDLKRIGPIKAFIKLREECDEKPSLNFLYAMVGALEDKNWIDIAKSERARLLFELEDYKELEDMLKDENLEIE